MIKDGEYNDKEGEVRKCSDKETTWNCCSESGKLLSAFDLPECLIDVVHHTMREVTIDHLKQNTRFIKECKENDDCQYRDNSEFCVVCLCYCFTNMPNEYPCVVCGCANIYCYNCAKGYSMSGGYSFGEDDCPMCLEGGGWLIHNDHK
jgi:hypothetical protein